MNSKKFKNIGILHMVISLVYLCTFSGCGGSVDGDNVGGEQPKPAEPNVEPEIEHLVYNPYQNGPYWYKGQTHVHTAIGPDEKGPTRLPVDDVVSLYEQAGYDFLSITEHNFVWPWTMPDNLVIINGCESGKSWENHLIALGVTDCPEECISNTTPFVADPLDLVPDCDGHENQLRVCTVLRQNGLAILAHIGAIADMELISGVDVGDIETGWSDDKMKVVNGYQAVEIVTEDNLYLDKWTLVLNQHRQIWGVAADDFHHQPNLGKGWIEVNSTLSSPGADDILLNMKLGNFYAVKRWSCKGLSSTDCNQRELSCGEPTYSGNYPKFTQVIDNGPSVCVYGNGASDVRFIDSNGLLPAQPPTVERDSNGNPLSFSSCYIWGQLVGGAEHAIQPVPSLYLRIEIEDDCGNVAYSQPMFVKADAPIYLRELYTNDPLPAYCESVSSRCSSGRVACWYFTGRPGERDYHCVDADVVKSQGCPEK